MGNGWCLIMELFDDEDDDEGVCKEATTEFIDWLASNIWRFSLEKKEKHTHTE